MENSILYASGIACVIAIVVISGFLLPDMAGTGPELTGGAAVIDTDESGDVSVDSDGGGGQPYSGMSEGPDASTGDEAEEGMDGTTGGVVGLSGSSGSIGGTSTSSSKSPFAGPSGISRTIASPTENAGENVTIRIDVRLSGGERFYLFYEVPPTQFLIVDKGSIAMDPDDHLNKAVIQNAADTSYTYVLSAPTSPGTYGFSGYYQIEGMDNPVNISGPSTIGVV